MFELVDETLKIKAENMQREHFRRRRWLKTVVSLSVIVSLCISYVLILPAVTLTEETFCGYEQHKEHNSKNCYTETETLVCELPEEGHKHTDECYEEERILSCKEEESDGHRHTEDCLDEEGELICGLSEGEGAHHHDETCYTSESTLICDKEEAEPHVHNGDCFVTEKELTCTIPIHEHTLQCYSNPEADIENRSVWERTVNGTELSGDWRDDVIKIAETQLGYHESERNYLVQDDVKTKNGYTRYGAWYGDPYGDWSAMFCSFCLHYAGVDAKKMPQEANCGKWIDILANRGLYHEYKSGYEPEAGDLIFMDLDGEANHVGFVYEVSEDRIQTIEGNKEDQVKFYSHMLNDTCIKGYAEIPLDADQEGEEAESEKLDAVEDKKEDTDIKDEHSIQERSITTTAKDGATVYVTGMLPEDAVVTIEPVEMDDVQLSKYIGRNSQISVKSHIVYDITLWSDGTEWHPDSSVSVQINQPNIEIENDKSVAMTHVLDDGNTESIETDISEDGNLEFNTDGFSLYIIYTYTVDFHYGDLTYSIAGESSILLSELFDILEIDRDINNVSSLSFSNDDLISIEKIENSDFTDWNLISLAAFDTLEELTVTMEDGEILTIHVTDASSITPTPAPNYIGTYPTGNGSTEWQITKEQYTGRSQDKKRPIDADGDGDPDIYLQKNVVPTGVENEFLVYLSIDKKMTWEDFLNICKIGATSTNKYHSTPLGTIISGNVGGNFSELMEHDVTGGYSNQFYILIRVYESQSSSSPLYSYYDRRYGSNPNCSNGTGYLVIPGLGNMISARTVTMKASGNGSGNPFVMNIYLEDFRTAFDFSFHDTVFNNVEDVLGDNIEFIEFINGDGSQSYNQATNTITWNPMENGTIVPEVSVNPVTGWIENSSQLVYKVRLNVEAEGFVSCGDTLNSKSASIAAGESNVVNNSAIVTYDKIALPETSGVPSIYGLEGEFPVPEVRGLLYDIAFSKENENGRSLDGAVFGVYEEDGKTPVLRDGNPLTLTTNAGQLARFADLPWGRYVLKEIKPPKHYTTPSSNEWQVYLCYTKSPSTLRQDDTPYEHNLRIITNDINGEWSIVNPKIDYKYNLEIHKVDQMNNPLGNAQFEVTDPNNEGQILTAQTNEDGVCRINSDYRANTEYVLVETLSPDGYYYLPSNVRFKIVENSTDDTYTAELVNEEELDGLVGLEIQETEKEDGTYEFMLVITVQNLTGYELPHTGGQGNFVYIFAGVLLIACALAIGCRKHETGRRCKRPQDS